MSLNGLDSHNVVNAHRTAVAEVGGWFLLQYTSRDELDVRSQGAGGYSELCGVLATTEEKAPLYGFLLYRQQKVLLKYIPDGTSRLLQARVAVHFQAIVDHYSHDAVLAASTSDEINDAALAAKCSLPTQDPAPDTSLQQPNLSETPENSEPQSSNPEVASILARLRANKLSQDTTTIDSADRISATGQDKSQDANASSEFLPTLDPSQAAYFMENASNESETPRVTPKPSSNFKYSPSKMSSPLPPWPRDVKLDNLRNASQASNQRASPAFDKNIDFTSHSTNQPSIDESRPFTADSKYSFAAWKPKIKLFPRPATNDSLRDPTKESSARQKLPSSIRIALQRGQTGEKYAKSEKSTKSSKPPKQLKKKSKDLDQESRSIEPLRHHPNQHPQPPQQQNRAPTTNGLPPLPKPAPASLPIARKEVPRSQSPAVASLGSDRQPVSPISDTNYSDVRGPTAGSPTSLAQKSSLSSMNKATVAPEKARLMKALQQRNQQLSDKSTASPLAEKQAKLNTLDTAFGTQANMAVDPKRAADSGVVLEGSNGRVTPISPLAADAETKQVGSGTKRPSDTKASGAKGPESTTADKPRDEAKRKPGLDQAKVANRRSRDPNRKRRTVISSHHTGQEDSDGFASDDSFMEELQNAKLEEAHQVAIPQTPVSPIESTTLSKVQSSSDRRPTITTINPALYHSTSPQSKSTSNQGQTDDRTRSPPPPPQMTSQTKPNAAKRVNPSSGISRRIQTLAEQSNQNNDAQAAYMRPGASQPALALKSSAASITRPSTSQTTPIIPTSQFSRSAYPGSQPMSITARIVRPNESETGDQASTRGVKSIDLQQSEVTIQHQQHPLEHTRSSSKVSFRRVDRPPSVSSRPESRGSILSNGTKRSIDMGLNFMGIKTDQRSPSRADTMASNKSLETVDESAEEKGKSKAARLLRRMSGMANSSSRKVSGAASSVMGGGGASDRGGRMRQGSLGGCIVGDLNVQFPDTLLWKRRWVEIDPSGFLVLSATTSQERQRSAPRRYHMSELKAPVTPNQDGQELPYSVLFDLVAGGTLQLACEDPIGQGQVLKRLADSHSTWKRPS